MKTTAPLVAVLLIACAPDARLIQTFDPDKEVDAGSGGGAGGSGGSGGGSGGGTGAGLELPDAGEEIVDAGIPAGAQCSIDGWCRDGLLPDGGQITRDNLRAIFALNPNAAYAVGDHGAFLVWNGIEWKRYGGGPADDLFAVWASATDDVWVAGASGDPEQPQGAYAHFNGTGFDAFYRPLARRPEALFGWGKNDVFSVGTGGEIRHFNANMNWLSTVQVTQSALTDVAGLNGKMWAVGADGVLLEQTTTGWTTMVTPTPAPPPPVGGLAAIIAFSPTKLFAVGGADWLEYDGTQWTAKRWPASLDVVLLGLWGAKPERMWGVGPGGAAWKFEDDVATTSDTGTTRLLRDVHGTDEAHVWAVGFDGTVLRRYGP